MEKEFCTCEQASALKELGFDECCTMYWRSEIDGTMQLYHHQDNNFWDAVGSNNSDDCKWVDCTAPLKQQALKWFREKHGLYVHMVPEFYTTGINFNWQILFYLPKEHWIKHLVHNGTFMYGDNGEYPTQELAENAAIEKMIDLVKNGRYGKT